MRTRDTYCDLGVPQRILRYDICHRPEYSVWVLRLWESNGQRGGAEGFGPPADAEFGRWGGRQYFDHLESSERVVGTENVDATRTTRSMEAAVAKKRDIVGVTSDWHKIPPLLNLHFA